MITAYFQHLKEPIINTEAIEKDQVKRLRVFSVRVISIPRRILEKRENKGPVFEWCRYLFTENPVTKCADLYRLGFDFTP